MSFYRYEVTRVNQLLRTDVDVLHINGASLVELCGVASALQNGLLDSSLFEEFPFQPLLDWGFHPTEWRHDTTLIILRIGSYE